MPPAPFARLLSTAVILMSLVAARGHAQSAERRFTLSNGLTVIIAPQAGTHQACVMVRYAAGHRDDPAGYRGLAHMTEHMTFRAGDTFGWLESVGATEFNGVTGADDTYYYAVIPGRSLASLLWLEARRMAFSASSMPKQEFAIEQRVVLREWSEQHDDVASELAAELGLRLYPAGHPYGRWFDRPSDVKALALRDVQWFVQTQYRPENAVLVLTGDVDAGQAEEWIRHYFGSVQATGKAGVRARLAPASLKAPVVERRRANISSAWLTSIWLVPGADDEVTMSTLELAAELLTDRLRETLVEARGSASSVAAVLEPLALQSRFTIGVGARQSDQVDDLLTQVDSIVAELASHGPGAEQLRAARARLDRRARLEADSLPTRALRLARGQPVEPDARSEISALPLQAALRRWLPKEQRGLGMLTGESP